MVGHRGQHFRTHSASHFRAIVRFVVLTLVLALGASTAIPSTSAADWDYDTCIANSGGRGDIPSVRWACEQTAEGINACSLWIGHETDSNSLEIRVTSLTDTTKVSYWGMCTDYEDTTSDLWVDDDNDAIADSKDLTRGTWATKPNSTKADLDIAKFVEDITPTETAEGSVYTRHITVGRCNGENTDSCSTQEQDISIIAPNQFFGQSRVADSSASWDSIADSHKATTGYVQSSATTFIEIPNCDPVSGCTAKFWHDLLRDLGGGSTTYSITRASNYYSVSSGTVISTTTESFSGITNGTGKNIRAESFTNKLYPGQVVCETLTFDANISTTGVTTTACAYATGHAQPTGANSLLNMQVKNSSVPAYNSFQSEVYAKPTDQLTYQATYTPTLQYTARLYPQKLQINSGTIYPRSGINTTYTTSQFFNNKYSGQDWNNAFSVQQSKDNFTNSTLIADHVYTNGLTTSQIVPNNYSSGGEEKVAGSDVGTSIAERAITNLNATTKTTPSQVTFTKSGNRNVANVITDAVSATAVARVPYNFKNSTSITPNDTTILYAGESKSISIDIATGTKPNAVTAGEYATIVRGAQWKLLLCLGQAECDAGNYAYQTTPSVDKNTIGDLNASFQMTGDTITRNIGINIPDAPAGTTVCLKSAVYPATSGADTNWDAPSGDGEWAYSTPACFTIAKKPSLQIWGGNTYSQSPIATATSYKKHLASVSPSYSLDASYDNHVFGSWTELGLISSGPVTGLASGTSFYSPQGSTSTSICDHSPLTFANTPCGVRQQVGSLGNSIAARNIASEKSAFISKFLYDTPNVSGAVDLTDESSDKFKDDSLYYYYSPGDLALPTSTIGRSQTKIVHTDGTLTITGDLTYADGYTSFSDIPKLVVYAQNILIDCSVSHIDAFLIAEENVVTCDNFERDFAHLDAKISAHINDAINSRPLTINGAVLASRLIPNRTYGAATGVNSGTPAETINFDPTLYSWGGPKIEGRAAASTLVTTYQHELSPRY